MILYRSFMDIVQMMCGEHLEPSKNIWKQDKK